jgi:hypothetical protein
VLNAVHLDEHCELLPDDVQEHSTAGQATNSLSSRIREPPRFAQLREVTLADRVHAAYHVRLQ